MEEDLDPQRLRVGLERLYNQIGQGADRETMIGQATQFRYLFARLAEVLRGDVRALTREIQMLNQVNDIEMQMRGFGNSDELRDHIIDAARQVRNLPNREALAQIAQLENLIDLYNSIPTDIVHKQVIEQISADLGLLKEQLENRDENKGIMIRNMDDFDRAFFPDRALVPVRPPVAVPPAPLINNIGLEKISNRYSLLKGGKPTGRYFTGDSALEAARHVLSRSKSKSGTRIILRKTQPGGKRKFCYIVKKKKLSACPRSRKGSRKGSRKASRKGSRKASRKGSRKGSRKASRKGSRKNSRKGSRRVSRKTSRKGLRKGSRKASRKGVRRRRNRKSLRKV